MILSPEQRDQIAQISASRDALEPNANAERLAAWQRRYWYRCTEVPAPRDPPKWPCIRSSIMPVPSNVTPLKKASAR